MSRPSRFAFALALLAGLSARAETAPGSLGSKDPGLFNLKGTIYFLPEETEGMPADLAKLAPQGTIYADALDVPLRSFTEGFPGVTNRFEWFGVVYTGTFQVEKPGEYLFRLSSDDGSRLWIDDRLVIDHDGVHGECSADSTVALTQGAHRIRVWYFQGPATDIALQLFVQPPGAEEEKIFRMSEFARDLGAALKKVDAVATGDGIRIKLDAGILFDTGASELKPAAQETLAAVAQVITAYPGCLVRIEGHTDALGAEAANLKLSERRAVSVKKALEAKKLSARYETKGLGKARPVASNETEDGRAQNRRVELFVKP